MACRFLIFSSLMHLLLAEIVQFGGELYMDGQNARNMGMGGYSASFSAGSNPAKLIYSNEPSIHFSHKNKYSGLSSVSTFSYEYPETIYGVQCPIYISLVNRSVHDIPDTRSAKNQDGSINYSRIDYFSQQEIGLAIASTYQINDITFGLTVKPFYTDLAEYKAWGISGDVGIISPVLNNKIELGFRIENLFSLNHWDTGTTENYVPLFIAGGQIKLKSLLFGVEGGSRLYVNSPLHYHAGFEFYKQKEIVIRGGISHNSSLSFGLGLVFNIFQIDYAYMPSLKTSSFEPSHIMGLGISLDKLSDLKDKISP